MGIRRVGPSQKPPNLRLVSSWFPWTGHVPLGQLAGLARGKSGPAHFGVAVHLFSIFALVGVMFFGWTMEHAGFSSSSEVGLRHKNVIDSFSQVW